ncbi:MAG: divalent cation tolerance protein CutA [Actinomycetota bacterium]
MEGYAPAPHQSRYRWNGRVEVAREFLLVAKTPTSASTR